MVALGPSETARTMPQGSHRFKQRLGHCKNFSPLEDCRAIPYDRSMNQGNFMTEQDQPGADKTTGGRRRDTAKQERLAAALRQNLNRRKAQSRVRETQAGDGVIGAAPTQDR